MFPPTPGSGTPNPYLQQLPFAQMLQQNPGLMMGQRPQMPMRGMAEPMAQFPMQPQQQMPPQQMDWIKSLLGNIKSMNFHPPVPDSQGGMTGYANQGGVGAQPY